MITKESQSLVDILLRMMPELGTPMDIGKPTNQSASALYDIWKKEEYRIAERKYRRPEGVTRATIQKLETEGLVRAESMGDTVTLTKKGGEILRQMILGDERSALEPEKHFDYRIALSNLKPNRKLGGKIASISKRSFGNWYQELKVSSV